MIKLLNCYIVMIGKLKPYQNNMFLGSFKHSGILAFIYSITQSFPSLIPQYPGRVGVGCPQGLPGDRKNGY